MNTTYVASLRTIIGLFIISVLVSCNTEDPFPLDPVRGIVAADNGNDGNGADLEVFIREQFENEDVVEYRAIVLKASNSTLSLQEANSTSFFQSASPDDIFPIQGIEFTTDSRDTDGDPIVENVDYHVGVLSIARDQKERSNSLLLTQEPFQLTQNNQVTHLTREFPEGVGSPNSGAGSITLNNDGNVIMGGYNIVGELSGDDREAFSIFSIRPDGTVQELERSYRLLGGNVNDEQGNIYQSILNQFRVIKIDASGNRQTIVLNNPRVTGNDGVYVNAQQEMFVVNPGSASVLKWNLENGENEIFARISESPRGITGDENGNLYISHNLESGLITRISPAGEVSELAQIPTSRPEFYTIEYLMWLGYLTYHEGNLYVAGMSTDRIYKVSLSGDVSVFVGSGTRGIPRGGALTANLNRPKGLVFSEDGNKLYISGSTDNVPQHVQASTPAQIWEVTIIE